VHPDAVVGRRDGGLLWQVAAFGLIGIGSTAATALLYVLLRSWASPLLANLTALVITTLLNTEANRRLTFPGSGRPTRRVHLQALVVFGLYCGLTSGALLLLQALVAHPSQWLEVVVLLVASVVGTAGRFVLLRSWVFREKAATEEESA
jgi:putative flippase GtrA